MTSPGLDIIIVSYNTRDDLLALPGVARTRTGPRDLGRIVVVDNASTRRQRGRRARGAGPVSTLDRARRNVGFARGEQRRRFGRRPRRSSCC